MESIRGKVRRGDTMNTKSFVDVLKSIENLHSLNGVSDGIIREAEKELGLVFSVEYYEYLKQYGIASANGQEFTGLGSSSRLSVIYNTIQERELHPGMPDQYYVVEQCNIDGIVILQSPDGKVYMIGSDGIIQFISDSLSEYLEKN